MYVVEPDRQTAACRDVDTELFYAEAGPAVAWAKLLCRSCPQRERCEAWGIAREEFGIWGGLTARERATERRQRGIRLS